MYDELPRALPGQCGVQPEYVVNFLNACEKANSEIHGIMIAKDDKLIFEAYNAPYEHDIPHIMHSFTKTLTNTAVSLCFTDGLLSLDDPILKFFPEYGNTANAFLKKCTVFNLITMRNGQKRPIGGNEWRPLKTSWKKAYFEVPFDKKPGEVFMYSSGNSYILSAIVQKLTGKTCSSLVKERIGRKIGLTDFPWMVSPEGICSGGNGVELTVEDMLRIGLLYIHRGNWKGEQLIDKRWFGYAFGEKRGMDPINDVQYNFHWEHTEDIWAARGMFGQTCGIVPSENIVFAITAADEDYSAMRLFQQEIINPIKKTRANVNMDDGRMEEILREKGLRMSLLAKNVSVSERRNVAEDYIFTPENHVDGITKIELHFRDDLVSYVMEDSRGRHTVEAGFSKWISGITSMTGAYLHHQYEKDKLLVFANAYWAEKDLLVLEWRYPEMAFFDRVSIQFTDEQIGITRSVNMNSQDRVRQTLICKV